MFGHLALAHRHHHDHHQPLALYLSLKAFTARIAR